MRCSIEGRAAGLCCASFYSVYALRVSCDAALRGVLQICAVLAILQCVCVLHVSCDAPPLIG
jgi:hypothetical protein